LANSVSGAPLVEFIQTEPNTHPSVTIPSDRRTKRVCAAVLSAISSGNGCASDERDCRRNETVDEERFWLNNMAFMGRPQDRRPVG
jgi:hypothetical protein